MPRKPYKILHVISGLNVGGAEMMLWRLLNHHRSNPDIRHSVVSLTTLGKVGEQLQEIGVEVHAVGMRANFNLLGAIFSLTRCIRLSSPDLVQTWMYHADLIGGIAAKLARCKLVVWGIRCSDIPQVGLSTTRMTIALCAFLSSRLPTKIVCCANAARRAHLAVGYAQSKMIVIPNGFNLAVFDPSTIDQDEARSNFGFQPNDIVVGNVGRYDRLKDQHTFVQAAMIIARKHRNVKFLMVGRDVEPSNLTLYRQISSSDFCDRFLLVGESNDVARCLASMNVFCLSSRKEGFPNVVGEAMAMQLPCVVTDAGDAADIVSDIGVVVEPGSAEGLAGGIEKMINKGQAERRKLGALGRQRIEQHYSIQRCAEAYEKLYSTLIDEERSSQT